MNIVKIEFEQGYIILTNENRQRTRCPIAPVIVLEVGTPVNAVASSLETALAGLNNDLVFTAKVKGVVGDDITVEYVDPHKSGETFDLSEEGTAIVVSLGTDTDGTASSADIGSGADGVVTITAAKKGTYGDALTVEVVVAGEINAPLVANIDGDAILVTLGTDANGDPDDTKNTATLVAVAVDTLDEVTAVASGTGATPLTQAEAEQYFTGGVDPTILTIGDDISAALVASELVTVADADGNDGTGVVTAMAETPLANGVDGTVASKGKVYQDASYLYVAVANNTTADTNWRRVDLGSAY